MTAIEIMDKYCKTCQRKALCAVPCVTVNSEMKQP